MQFLATSISNPKIKWIVHENYLKQFLNYVPQELWSISTISNWEPPEPKEVLTKKQREAEPKEPIPLSRFTDKE